MRRRGVGVCCVVLVGCHTAPPTQPPTIPVVATATPAPVDAKELARREKIRKEVEQMRRESTGRSEDADAAARFNSLVDARHTETPSRR